MGCSEAMVFRVGLVEIGQKHVCNNNRKDSFEQYLPEKFAALLHDCCWNVAGV